MNTETKEFLDNIRFPINRILQWEFPSGPNFISFGGEIRALQTFEFLSLQPGHSYKILDIGSGMGGTQIKLLESYPNTQFDLVGVDPTRNMTKLAKERLSKYCDNNNDINVQFITEDIMNVEFEHGTFDIIYSRDSILYVKNKSELFKKLYNWLKPNNGILFITDYFEGENLFSNPKFLNHSKSSKHIAIPLEKYLEYIKLAGFVNIETYFKSNELISSIKTELLFIESSKDTFCRQWNEMDYEEVVREWTGELERFSGKGYESYWIVAKRNTI